MLFENQKNNIKAKFKLSPDANEIVNSYPWGGNIRELKNCVEYLNALDKDIIEPNDLNNIFKKETFMNIRAIVIESGLYRIITEHMVFYNIFFSF